jgi:hypothetical protein
VGEVMLCADRWIGREVALSHIALVLAPAFVAARLHDALLAAERRLFLYGWRVSQLATDLSPRDLLTLGTNAPGAPAT